MKSVILGLCFFLIAACATKQPSPDFSTVTPIPVPADMTPPDCLPTPALPPKGMITVSLASVTTGDGRATPDVPLVMLHQVRVPDRSDANVKGEIDTRQTIPKDQKLEKAGGVLFSFEIHRTKDGFLAINTNLETTQVRFTEFSNGKTGKDMHIALLPMIDSTKLKRTNPIHQSGQWFSLAGVNQTMETAGNHAENHQRSEAWFVRLDDNQASPVSPP